MLINIAFSEKVLIFEPYQLRDIARQCSENQANILKNKRSSPARFRDADQWTLGDLKALRRQTDDLEDDTLKMEDESLALKTRIAELQSLLLKGQCFLSAIFDRIWTYDHDKHS